MDVEAVLDKVPAVSMDFTYLYEKGGQPTLVTADHESGRTWAYALQDKTILSGEGWIQRRVARDNGNVGHKDVNIMVKSDWTA